MRHKITLKLLFFSILIFFSSNTYGQATGMSLNDCIAYALANHPDIKVAELQLKDADWQIKESKSSGLPQLSAGIDYQYFIQRPGIPQSALFPGGGDEKVFFNANHSLSPSISLNQLFFSNSYRVALKAAELYRDYAQSGMEVTREKIRNQVIDAYLPTLVISENLDILDKNISTIEKLLNETTAINKAGFAEQLDVDRLDLSLSTLRSDRSSILRQQEMVLNALKFSMGMPVSEAIVLSDDLDKLIGQYADVDLTSELNLMNRSEYVQLLKGRELGTMEIELNSKTWLPTVSGFLNYQPGWQGGFGDDTKWFFIPAAVAGVSVQVPIWDGGTTKAKRERATISVQTIDVQKRMLENAITLEVENARKQFVNAQERVNNQRRNLALAERIYNTTETKYKAGVGSSLELTQAEQSLYAAQKNLIDAMYEFLQAKAAVKKSLGAN